jgi:hypothetical protein
MKMRPRLAFTLLLCLSIAGPALAQAPKAVPVEPIKNFDIVPRGEQLQHDFLIKNEGDAVLEITDVHPACGCTVASFDPRIEPGKTGRVTAKVDTQDFAGPISKSIAVFTNDKTNPKLQLVVKADVKPYISVDPGYARFNYVQGEPLRPITQLLWTEDGKDVNVVRVKPPYNHLKVSYREAKEEERRKEAKGRQWMIDVELVPNAPVGALTDYVEVETDHPKQKLVKLPISGFVRPRQHITPVDIDFGELEGAALPLQRSLHFTNFATEGIEVAKVETGLAGVTLTAKPNEKQPGHRLMLTLTLSPEMPKGDFNTQIKIYTTDPQKPFILLPIKGSIK